jgi:ferredoxin
VASALQRCSRGIDFVNKGASIYAAGKHHSDGTEKCKEKKMSLLIVDENKCKQDDICVRDCPTAIIRLKDKESVPELVPGGEPICLGCGHCVAVCPHGALSHKVVPLQDCPSIQKATGLPKDHTHHYPMMLGTPKAKYFRLPERKPPNITWKND